MQLAAIPGVQTLEPSDLSTFVFRVRCNDDTNRAVLNRVNAADRVFWSSTRLDEQLTLRMCVMSHRTHRCHVDETLSAI